MKGYLAAFSAVVLLSLFVVSAAGIAGLRSLSGGGGIASVDGPLESASALVAARYAASGDAGEREALAAISSRIDLARAEAGAAALRARSLSDALVASAAFCAGLAVLAVALLWFFTWRHVASPLIDLSRAMDAASDGAPAPPASRGVAEIRRLRDSFAAMCSRLSGYRERARMAERETVGRFLVHEIRNAITPLPLSLRAAGTRMGRLPPGEDRDAALAAIAEAREAGNAVNELLETFRTSYRFPEPRMAPVDMAALVGRLAEIRDPRVRLCLAEGLPEVDGDATLLAKAAGNLVRNALEACDAKGEGATVSVSLSATPDGLSLEVADSGCGMGADDAAKAFEEWFTTKRKGMGLGLPFVRRVADSHGAVLSLSSAMGEGTRVTISMKGRAHGN